MVGVLLALGVEPVTHLNVVRARTQRVGVGGLDLLWRRLVAADVRVVFAVVERIGRDHATVVEMGDVPVDGWVETRPVRWRCRESSSGVLRWVFRCGKTRLSILLLGLLAGLLLLVERWKIVGVGEAGIVQVGEARVVDWIADRDGYQVSAGVDDDFPRPDPVDGVAGYSARGQYLGFPVAAGLIPAVGCGVVEGGVYIDAVRVVQLVHIHRLPEGAVGQTCQLSLVGEPVQVVACDLRFPGDGVLRTPGQRHEPVSLAWSGVADVRTDVEVAGIAGREAEAENLRPARIHAKQRVPGVEERVAIAPVTPYRRQAVAVVADHQPRRVDRCCCVVERLAGHGPGQVIGQPAVGASGFECIGLDTRVAPPHVRIEEVVFHNLGEVLRVQLVGSLAQRLLLVALDDTIVGESQAAILKAPDDVVVRHATLGGEFVNEPPLMIEKLGMSCRVARIMRWHRIVWVQALWLRTRVPLDARGRMLSRLAVIGDRVGLPAWVRSGLSRLVRRGVGVPGAWISEPVRRSMLGRDSVRTICRLLPTAVGLPLAGGIRVRVFCCRISVLRALGAWALPLDMRPRVR